MSIIYRKHRSDSRFFAIDIDGSRVVELIENKVNEIDELYLESRKVTAIEYKGCSKEYIRIVLDSTIESEYFDFANCMYACIVGTIIQEN